MKILGIETSCDETAVSIVEAGGDLKDLDFKLLGSALNSQVKIHAGYGGVVPALAKREHQKNLPLILDEALKKADTDLAKIDLITVTVGPGLEPALWAGITFAEELGKKLKIPVIPANHMEGHIASVLFNKTNIEFPALALLISGGHTELVLLTSWGEKEKIGKTQDDAVGEAFDKVGRLLGLSYPGGPQISKLARVAREFEDAVIETLISKTKAAIEKYSPKTLVIGGGVIANKALRENFLKLSKNYPEMKILIPEKSLTTDNATMIAAAGFIEYLRNNKPNRKLKAQGNLDIVS